MKTTLPPYTPGPWAYQNDIEMIVSRHPEWNWSSICKLATGEDSRQEESNARLIAAAPELLEALQGIVENEHGCTCESECDGECWHAIALRAIAKAEGAP